MLNRKAIFENIRSNVEDIIEEMPTHGTVDLQPLFFSLTLKSAMFLLFGEKVPWRWSNQDKHDHAAFANAFALGQEYLSHRSRLGGLYWLLDTPRFRKTCDTARACIGGMVQEVLDRTEAPTQDDVRRSFMGTLLRKTNDRIAMQDQCMNMLLAARDTTACCLSWTM